MLPQSGEERQDKKIHGHCTGDQKLQSAKRVSPLQLGLIDSRGSIHRWSPRATGGGWSIVLTSQSRLRVFCSRTNLVKGVSPPLSQVRDAHTLLACSYLFRDASFGDLVPRICC